MRNSKFPANRQRTLLKNESGNVMWLTALMMFPMMAMIGSGVDLARYYAAQSRLQQACDAGALAARKSMSNSGSLNATAIAEGQRMFKFNFPDGTYQSSSTNFTAAQINATEIKGAAQTTMPATVMKIFGFGNKTLNVDCSARLEISNVDIVFVLDTTGSMLTTNSGDTADRITGLRNAVMSFFDIIMGAKTAGSQIRLGFVPYSTNVNVGKLLVAENSSWVADQWDYQSRRLNTPASWWSGATYDYLQLQSPSLSAYKTGSKINLPVGSNGSNVETARWSGCIEEIATTPFSGSGAPSSAKDLDISYVPSGSNAQKWKPHLPEAQFDRGRKDPRYNTSTNYSRPSAPCPSQAMRLTPMDKDDRSNVQSYLNTLVATGNTYHDIGMIWGGRWIAPVGIFGPDNSAPPPNGLPQSRHIIFMTDGAMQPDTDVYSAYGIEEIDQRITGGVNSTSATTLAARHNDRLQIACTQAKTVGTATVWVVGFGTALTSNLTQCSSPGLAYQANNSAELEARFKEIAQRITFLRLSQ